MVDGCRVQSSLLLRSRDALKKRHIVMRPCMMSRSDVTRSEGLIVPFEMLR